MASACMSWGSQPVSAKIHGLHGMGQFNIHVYNYVYLWLLCFYAQSAVVCMSHYRTLYINVFIGL